MKDSLSKKAKTEAECQDLLSRLHFFHIWIFYYLYSADHKLLKAILTKKFTFVNTLFGKDVDRLRKNFRKEIETIYGDKVFNIP